MFVNEMNQHVIVESMLVVKLFTFVKMRFYFIKNSNNQKNEYYYGFYKVLIYNIITSMFDTELCSCHVWFVLTNDR